jgi:hypothetical protein
MTKAHTGAAPRGAGSIAEPTGRPVRRQLLFLVCLSSRGGAFNFLSVGHHLAMANVEEPLIARRPVVGDSEPFVRTVLWRTVANTLSMGFVVRQADGVRARSTTRGSAFPTATKTPRSPTPGETRAAWRSSSSTYQATRFCPQNARGGSRTSL